MEIMACNIDIEDPNATESAFIKFLRDCRFEIEQKRLVLMPNSKSYNRILFTSTRKKSATILKKDGIDWLYTFGNADRILKCCSALCNENGRETELTEDVRKSIYSVIKSQNEKTLRTLGIAYKMLSEDQGGKGHMNEISEEVYEIEESGLTFVGLVGLKDPLRDGVPNAVKTLKNAGITVRMVTGDSKETAIAIAKECGILPENHESNMVMLGDEFAEAVGGLKYLCKSCLTSTGNESRECNAEKIDTYRSPLKISSKEKYMIQKKSKIPKKKKKNEEDKKLCPKCDSELQATAGDMEIFKQLEKTLLVIASCRPTDKYLLVASLKFLYLTTQKNMF